MDIPLVLRTLLHLKPVQMFARIRNFIVRPTYREYASSPVSEPVIMIDAIPTMSSLSGDSFTFVGQAHKFTGWNCSYNGMLWAYNLNYMDWLCQEGMPYEQGAMWIDRFIEDIPVNRIGMDPYPTALRGINWIRFIVRNRARIDVGRSKRWNDSLYSQYRLLEKKLEWHLSGNHLLEDAISLYVASVYFRDRNMFARYSALLKRQLEEQVLPDGAHYEQSPMYHCILLGRLLDCCNISSCNPIFPEQENIDVLLKKTSSHMLGHLESIVYRNGEIPLVNDAAYEIAPGCEELYSYARRLGIDWERVPLGACGYRKLVNRKYEVLVDVGNFAASYQPGHSHADALSYELRVDDRPVVVDTGISTYDKNARRQYERSTVAHNCVSPRGEDSSEVWGGFRVGRRCRVLIIHESENCIAAVHDGFAGLCIRQFELSDDGLVVEDWYGGDAVSYVHVAENVDLRRISVEGACEVSMKNHQYSTEYNKFHDGKVMEMHFNGYLKYKIR